MPRNGSETRVLSRLAAPVKINDLELFLVEIKRTELDAPVRSVLVRLTTDSGALGWGESALRRQAAELLGRREALRAAVVGRSIFDVEELHSLEVLKDARLRSAVEMASWDLIGRAAGEPLCHLLGGGYRERIPLAVRLPNRRPDRVAQVAREFAEQGFHSQIITAGKRVQQDLQTLAAVRQSVGDRAELRFDAAAIYDRETALDLCAELEQTGLQFLVDPLDADDLQPIAALQRQTSVPLAVSRAIRGPVDVLATIRCGAAGFVVVDLGRVGGIVPARNCAVVADAGGVAALLTAGPSLGIATAAMLQLAAATPHFSGCNESSYHQLYDDVLAEPLEIVDGMMAVPQTPGLGIEVDRRKVERYQVT